MLKKRLICIPSTHKQHFYRTGHSTEPTGVRDLYFQHTEAPERVMARIKRDWKERSLAKE